MESDIAGAAGNASTALANAATAQTAATTAGSDATSAANVTQPLTAAALSAAYARSGLRKRDLPRMPTVLPPSMATPPTEATSGPGGAGPIASPTTLPYNTPNVTFLGSVPVHITALSTDYFQNQINSQNGSGAQACAVEFDYYGAAFSIIYRAASAGSSYWWVWVDGIPATAAPVAWANASSNSKYYHGVTFATAALRRIRIYYSGADFGGMQVKATDSVVPTAKPGWSVAMLGDSYTQATGATSALQAFPTTLGMLLGCETFLCGIAGTGYTAGVVFGDPSRTAPILTANPRYVVIVGSINDQAATPTTVGAAATALYSWFATNLPATKLFVAGVQPSNGMATTGNNVANNAALKTAALAAPNVVTFIDPYTDVWFTGTGHVGATVGDGNRDIFMWTDGIHPSQDGHDYWARRLYADIAAALTA